jgi:hypothetical protein
MAALQKTVRSHPAVSAVAVNERTGSIVVHGSPGKVRGAVDEFLEIVEESGHEGGGEVGVATAVGLVQALDRRVHALTGHRFRLRLLVPATFLGLGVRALIVDGLTVGSLPWFVLIYFGIDSFIKLYPEHAPTLKTSPNDGTSQSRGR